MKSKLKSVLLITMIAAAVLLITGCTKEENYHGVSVDAAQTEFEKMCWELIEYSANADGEKVAEYVRCYPEGFDECTYMSIFNDYNTQGFPDYLFYVIPLDDQGVYYLAGIINSITTDGQTQSFSYLLTISFADGSCRIDCSPKAAELAGKVDIYPEGMKDAEINGRFNMRLNGQDMAFAVKNAVIPNCFMINAYCIWQNGDGSVDVAVSMKNGTEDARSVESVTVTVMNNNGEEIVSYTEQANMVIDSQMSDNWIVSIPADYINAELDMEEQIIVFVQG